MPRLPIYPATFLIILALGAFVGCDPGTVLSDLSKQAENPGESASSQQKENLPVSGQAASSRNQGTTGQGQLVSARKSTSRLPVRTQQTILIASFNIQTFGESKLGNSWVMEHLAEIVRQFDIVAVQEIRTKNENHIPEFLRYINARGLHYDYLIGERLGRTASKEQYVFLFDTDRVITSRTASYTVNDSPQDLLHREPFVARFVAKTNLTRNPFRFTLANIHTDPDEVAYELNVLDDVYRSVRLFEYQQAREDDLILLGDFNANLSKFGELGRVPGLRPVIQEACSNTRENNLMDNIFIDEAATTEWTGKAGVLNLADFFENKLKRNDLEKLSDHYPVWAEFYIEERSPGSVQTANQPQRTFR